MDYKKTVFPLMAVALSAFMAACSDNDSTSEEEVDSSLDGSGEGLPGDIAGQPITEDDLKDDGSSSVTSLNVQISGVAEIGPFDAGATVTLNSVDVESMILREPSLTTVVTDGLGNYSISGDLGSAVASIEVQGNYLNFTTEEVVPSSGIKALSDLRNRTKLNVNVLTRLEYDRVQFLVSQMGLSFTAAKSRAEKEVLAALGLMQDSTLFEDISLYDRNQAAVNLLAATTVFLSDRTTEEFEASLAAVAADIASDGTWDDAELKALLGDIAYGINTGYPMTVLSDKNNSCEMEYFSVWVDHFWAAAYGLGACDINNQNEVKTNGNAYSSMASSKFVCQDSMWKTASEAVLTHLAAVALFGECTESNQGEMKTDAEGKYMICKRTMWSEADESDVDNLKVSGAKGACSSANEGALESFESNYYVCLSQSWKKLKNAPIDYSKGRAMNKRLGRGINMGNSWESTGDGATADCGWNNCIDDNDFEIVKQAGFNSVRIPVRWNQDASNSSPYTLDAGRLSGVKADIDLALAQGLAVIVNFHHYTTLNDAAGRYSSNKDRYESEKQRFLGMWEQVAKEMDSYPDSLLVLEIFNEPHDMKQEQVNDIMMSAYEVIRKNAPGKTIMFESNGYSKFGQIKLLDLPADGNIIVSGHYYEPYSFTHQGHGYDCNNSMSESVLSSVTARFKEYVDSASAYFPDVNGGHVPMNMGEFGVSGQHRSSCGDDGVSDDLRAQWTDAIISAAEKNDMSWHYWGFTRVGGFEAYDRDYSEWYPELLQVFSKYTSK